MDRSEAIKKRLEEMDRIRAGGKGDMQDLMTAMLMDFIEIQRVGFEKGKYFVELRTLGEEK